MNLWKAVAEYVRRLIAEKQRRVGVVTGVDGVQVLVNIEGTVSKLQRIASYTTPVAGDTVAIDFWGDRALVIGKIA